MICNTPKYMFSYMITLRKPLIDGLLWTILIYFLGKGAQPTRTVYGILMCFSSKHTKWENSAVIASRYKNQC